MSDLFAPIPPPPGISVYRDPFATNAWGDPCLRVHIQHREGDVRRVQRFEVPYYKTVGYRRVGLFRWKTIEVTDHDRISGELNERGWGTVRELLDLARAGGAEGDTR